MDAKLQECLRNGPPTPYYLYLESRLLELSKTLLKETKGLPLSVHFAMKCNSNPHILKIFKELGIGLDIVSGGEFRWAKKLGFTPQSIVFSGVGKTDAELELAVEESVGLLCIESESELKRLSKIAARLEKVLHVSVRLNPDIDAGHHPYIRTGTSDHKFGVDLESAFDLYVEKLLKDRWIKPVGCSFHLGSQISELEPMYQALEKTIHFANSLRKEGISLSHLDVGGGLAADYLQPERSPPFSEYARFLKEAAKQWTGVAGPNAKILCELGRSLVAQAGLLVSRVIAIKRGQARTFVIIDAGMNDLLRPALYQSKHPLECVPQKSSQRPPGKMELVDIVGPICESSDVFESQVSLEVPDEGDFLILGAAGAYGHVMSSTYNGRPRPAEWLWTKDQTLLLSRPEQPFEI